MRSTARGLILVATPLSGLMVLTPYLLGGFPSVISVVWAVTYIVLFGIGVLLSRHVTGLWILIAAMVASICLQLVYPNGTSEYSSIDNIVMFASISAIMLSTRWIGLGFAIFGGLVTWMIWEHGPSDVVAAAHLIGEGLDSELQITAGLMFAWWAWSVLQREARVFDLGYEQVLIDTQRSRDALARARARQELATVIHESLLNTIRYVFNTPRLNTGLLKEEIERTDALLRTHEDASALSLDALQTFIIEDAPSRTLVTVRLTENDLELERDVFHAVRGAVAEATLNAVNHGNATHVDVTMHAPSADRLYIEISDNGSGIVGEAVEGFGLRHAIVSNIESVGGRVQISQRDSGVNIQLALPVTQPQIPAGLNISVDGFAKARLIVTAALAGLGLGGLFYSLALVTTFTPREWLPALVSIPAFLIPAIVVFRRRTLSPVLGGLASILMALVPALLTHDLIQCTEVSAIIGLVGASSAAVVTVALWTRYAAGVVGIALWVVTPVMLLSSIPTSCRQSTIESVAYIVSAAPILLIFGYFVMRVFAQASATSIAALDLQQRERAQARAAELVDAEYGELVSQGQSILRDVVSAGVLTDADRSRLIHVEAKIRAEIQVDPESSGGMAFLARDVVHRFANRGLNVRTRAFVDSGDGRIVSEEARDALRALLADIHSGELEVQLITDGTRDILTLRFTQTQLMLDDSRTEVGGVTLVVQPLDPGFAVVLLRQLPD